MLLHGVWIVVDDKTYLITWYVICCAKCQFLPFLPFSSITIPRYWKLLPVAKTPENSTLRVYRLILLAYDTIRCHFRHYRTKIRKWRIGIDSQKLYCSTPRITHIEFFSKHHLPHHSKSYLLSLTPLYILYQPFYCIRYHIHYNHIDITILIPLCNIL